MNQMNQTYILVTFLIMCWTFTPFLTKHASKKLNTNEYLIFNHGLCTILVLGYIVYLNYHKSCDIRCLRNLNKNELLFSLVGAITTVLGSVILIKLIKENDASYIMANIHPLVLILTVVVGYFIFNEQITIYKIVGGSIVVGGLLIMNKA